MKPKLKTYLTIFAALLAIVFLGQITPKNGNQYIKQRFYRLKAITKKKSDILILGDSRAAIDVSPFEIENALPGYKAFNMGFSNGGLNPEIFELAESRLTDNDNRKAMILCITALTIHPSSLENKQYNQEISRPREKGIEIMYFSHALTFFSPVTPLRFLNHLKHQKPKRQYLQTFYENGWSKSILVPPDTLHSIPYYEDDYDTYKVSYAQLDQICEQISEWTNKEIMVVCFRPPTTIQMKKLEENLGGFNDSIVEQRILNAGGHWLNFNFKEYFSYDGSHLDDTSAIKLSKKIGYYLKKNINNSTLQ